VESTEVGISEIPGSSVHQRLKDSDGYRETKSRVFFRQGALHQVLGYGMSPFPFVPWNTKARQVSRVENETDVFCLLRRRSTFLRVTHETDLTREVQEKLHSSSSTVIIWSMEEEVIHEPPNLHNQTSGAFEDKSVT
jgi:hypothetical protein